MSYLAAFYMHFSDWYSMAAKIAFVVNLLFGYAYRLELKNNNMQGRLRKSAEGSVQCCS